MIAGEILEVHDCSECGGQVVETWHRSAVRLEIFEGTGRAETLIEAVCVDCGRDESGAARGRKLFEGVHEFKNVRFKYK